MPLGALGLGFGRLGAAHKASATIGPDTTVQSAWAGAVTDTAFTAAHYLGADSGGTRLAVSVNSDLSSPVYSGRVSSSSQTVKHTITGLIADTAYYFGVEINNVVKTTKKGQFKTMPAGASSGSQVSFRFSLYQCLSGYNNGKSLDQLRALSPKPRFNIINGDIHYDDISTNSEALFDASLEGVLAGTYSGPFLREVPQYYIYDDHDFGPNDSDSTSPSRTASIATFRRRAPNPAGVYSGATDPVNYSFVQGRLRFIVTDERSQKDSTSVLGATQKQWFKDQLDAAYAAGQFVCWVHTLPYTGKGWTDGWNSGTRETERAELATYIVTSGMGARCFVIAGDAHAIQIDDGTNGDYSDGGNLRMQMIVASPAYAGSGLVIGAPFSYGAGITTKTSQVGYFDVTDNGASGLSIVFTAIGMDGGDVSPTTLATTTFTLPKAAPSGPSTLALVQEFYQRFASSSATCTATLRTQPTNGNLLIAHIVVDRGAASLTMPAGWTRVTTDTSTVNLLVSSWYKVVGASEPQSIAFTMSGARNCSIAILEVSGQHATPIGQFATDTGGDPTTVNGVSMAFTSATDSEWALAFVGVDNGGNVTGARSWSTGFIERANVYPLTQPGFYVASKQLGAAGADSADFTYTGTADQLHGRVITIKAASTTPNGRLLWGSDQLLWSSDRMYWN